MAARPASIPQAATLTFDRPARVRAALVAALFVATFWHLLAFIPPLGLLVHAWIYEADWSHGPLHDDLQLLQGYFVHA